MDVLSLVKKARRQGINFDVTADGRLEVDAPMEGCADILREIEENRDELLAYHTNSGDQFYFTPPDDVLGDASTSNGNGHKTNGKPKPSQQSEPLTYRRYTAAELDETEFQVEYLIDNVLAEKHVGGILAASKGMKTTIAADLSFSVAIGGHFLGYFPVQRAARVAFMSGETGLPTLQETFRRIADAAGKRLRDCDGLIISDQLPRFGHLTHMDALRKFIDDDGIELLVIDPLYLCCETEGRESSLFAMGPLLKSVADVATDCGATLLILHHMTQGSGKGGYERLPELFDSAWAGTQQFFRQWIAMNRRSPYDPSQPGRHELRLVTGGSMGHGTGVALDIEEGQRSDQGGRRWEVTLKPLSAAESEVARAVERRKIAQMEERDVEDRRRIMDAATTFPNGDTQRAIRELAGISGQRAGRAITCLLKDGKLTQIDVLKNKRTEVGYVATGN